MRAWMCSLRVAIAAWLILGGLAVTVGVPQTARAQANPVTESAADDQELASLLEKGRRFEQDRRWADALNHYEQAVRNHPSHRELQDRLLLAKAHFDVGRRYADSSFVTSVTRSSHAESLEVYAEVLAKVQTHYVHAVNWQDLVRQGTFHLEVALTEPVFLRRYVAAVPAEQINVCRREIRQLTDARNPRTRAEARDVVERATRIAADRLGLPPSAAVFEYVCGAMNSLDDYSSFLTGDQLDDVFSQIEGNFVGLGIELKSEDGMLRVVNVIPKSPADKGGLHKNDRIVAVDGRPTQDVSTDAAADMLRGAEGTTVALDILDPGDRRRSVQLLRERVEVPSVEDVRIIDGEAGIGYLRLTSFQKTTSRDVDAALWKLHQQGMKRLIIDVRGNPGGLLNASVEVADKFLTDGLIVMTRGRSANEDNDYKAHNPGTWRVPLTVLIDADSASASEIFAGAIRDHQRGKIVGQRSYGKGSVQGIFPLASSTAGVRLTTAKFYSPNGQEINKRGVVPDVAVRVTAKPAIDTTGARTVSTGIEDAALQAAIQVARQTNANRAP